MAAAVRVLDGAGWLAHPEFVADCVEEVAGDPPVALVDWPAVATFVANHDVPEVVLSLRLALALAEQGRGDPGPVPRGSGA